LSQPVVLSEGSDYQLQAAFTTAEIGNNKEVTVTVTLLNNNYSLENNTYQTTANILEEIKGEEGGESGNPDEGGEDGNPDEEEIPAVVPEDLWVEGIQDYDYSGKTIVQKELKVYHGNQQLVLNKDYTVKYKNNQKAGVATITITGKGNYAGTIVKNFEIKPLNLSEAILSDEVVTLVYNKKVQKAVTTVSYELQGKIIKLKSGKDFEFVYPGTDSAKTGEYDAKAFQAVNENPGYTVYIKGKGNYTGERTFLQKITEKTLISKVSFIKIKDQKYSETVQITGEAKPEVVLKDKGVELRQKAEGATGNDYDYTVEYRNNKSVGTATIIIKANENSEKYAGTRIVTFKITGTPISKVKIDGFVASKIWTGEEITQKVSLLPNIKGNTTPLQEGEDKDYIVSYSNNIEVGKATVIFTGKGGYTGTVKKTFKITGSPINKVGVEGLPDIPVEYAGKAIELEGVWLRNSEGRILTEVGEDGKGDYAVSYKNNHKAGTSTITFTGKNGYTGKLSKTFKIVASDMNSDKIQVQLENDYPYSKGGAQPEPTVICGWGENAVILTKGVDYTLSYANNKAVTDENSKKDPMVTITGKGGFKGKLIKNFIITEGNLSQVSAKVTDVVYKKKSNICKPTIVLTDSNGKKLIAGTDYDKRITYSYKTGGIVQSYEIIPQGTKILARINGINNYAGTVKTVEFSYVKSLLSKASVTILPQAYSGQEVTLKEEDIEVKIGNDTLVLGTDYEIVGYTNNRGKGTAKVTLRGIGNYGGEKT
ncbi:MAG: hypothetical protein IKW28_08675, partial [Lachnospiraceae bacterium]|nr:hypothetical protein [Lachnospiraceae bacterium]